MCMPPLLLHCQTEEIKSGAGEPHLISSALITSCCLVSPRGAVRAQAVQLERRDPVRRRSRQSGIA